MGFFTKGAKRAAKRQADATLAAATMQQNSDNLQAQAAVQQQQTMIAQKNAATAAAELLQKPMEGVEVNLRQESTGVELDPVTRRRRTARSSFMARSANSGINII